MEGIIEPKMLNNLCKEFSNQNIVFYEVWNYKYAAHSIDLQVIFQFLFEFILRENYGYSDAKMKMASQSMNLAYKHGYMWA